ncbi:MAG: aspartate aminotransferase family protein [Acidobacteriia bacterium]|nr:aspartate aminotransferase family protein [Terriglobia bacterium]
MLETKNIFEIEDRYTAGTYYKRPIELVRGEGARVWDRADRRYIDCVGGQGVANIGHANPAVARALAEQAQSLSVCTELFYHEARAGLLERLAEITPDSIQRFFLCNSGAESIEAALKLARLSTGRTDFVATMRGYHGKTLGALSATYNKDYRDPFLPLVPGFTHVPFDRPENLRNVITEKTAGFLVEIVQGESGVRPGSAEFFKAAAQRCREVGALFIIDEVQTGFCRTGRMFACQHFNLQPDLICMSKAMAGGVPIGALGMSEAVSKKLFKLAHTSTFGGNPLACAAANAAIDFMRGEKLDQRAAQLGENFMRRLGKIESKKIREVRGMGLMVGIELKEKSGPYIQKLMERGILVLGAGPTVIRYLPPLVIEESDLMEAAEQTQAVLTETGATA